MSGDDGDLANPFLLEGERAGSISLGWLLLALLKIGSIGFGAGMAVIALMEREFVHKRRLISVDEFVHGVGLGQILGPFAVNTSIFLGYRLSGRRTGADAAAFTRRFGSRLVRPEAPSGEPKCRE